MGWDFENSSYKYINLLKDLYYLYNIYYLFYIKFMVYPQNKKYIKDVDIYIIIF